MGTLPTVLSDLVLATDLAGNARFLVSADRELQRLGMDRGVRIVSARGFVEAMGLL